MVQFRNWATKGVIFYFYFRIDEGEDDFETEIERRRVELGMVDGGGFDLSGWLKIQKKKVIQICSIRVSCIRICLSETG